MPSLIIYTDGSCRNNGKTNARAGIGVHFSNYPQFDISRLIIHPPHTSIRAELEAIITAIEFYMSNKKKFSDDINKLRIITDSKFVYNCYTMWISKWKRNNWIKSDKESVLNQDLLKRLDTLEQESDIPIIIHHTNGHSKEPLDKSSQSYKVWKGNNIADALATAATA